MLRVCALLLLAALVALPTRAQRAPDAPDVPNAPDVSEPWERPRTAGWFGTGIGPSSSGIGVSVQGTLVRGNHLLTLRGSAATRTLFEDLCLYYCPVDPDAGVADVSLLYGRPLVFNQSTFVSLGAGLGVVEDATDRYDVRYVVGVPFEAQLGYRTRYVGLNLYGFANLNEARSFAGLGVGVTYGLHN